MDDIVAVGMERILFEIGIAIFRRLAHLRARSGEHRRIDQTVVFEKTHENAPQNPRDRNLRQILLAPGLEWRDRTVHLFRRLVLGADGSVDLLLVLAALAQIALERLEQLAQVV
jgi:hypothetical protein